MLHLGLRLARDGGDATAFLDCRSSTGDRRRPDFLALFRGEKPGLHHFSFSVPDYSAEGGLAPGRVHGEDHM